MKLKKNKKIQKNFKIFMKNRVKIKKTKKNMIFLTISFF